MPKTQFFGTLHIMRGFNYSAKMYKNKRNKKQIVNLTGSLYFREKSRLGFTLIEVLVVVSLITLMASIILVNLSPVRKKAENSARIQTILQIVKALELYHSIYGGYPDVTDSIACLARTPAQNCLDLDYHGNDTLNTQLKEFISVDKNIFTRPFYGQIGVVPTQKDFGGIEYIVGDPTNPAGRNCFNNGYSFVCDSYVLIWYMRGMDQSCRPGYIKRRGVIPNNDYQAYDITLCALETPSKGNFDSPY